MDFCEIVIPSKISAILGGGAGRAGAEPARRSEPGAPPSTLLPGELLRGSILGRTEFLTETLSRQLYFQIYEHFRVILR